ncbi:unnamed protein product [Phytophthora fragariaefolia]|uniref:Unnamed protein product n=1 Tax=Phytophthora fragariaefolia TaxID=1490495 RepID=A0A9W6UBK5_9STRA|nr:unnamed protein product [Phytophthora fragariaefolia]
MAVKTDTRIIPHIFSHRQAHNPSNPRQPTMPNESETLDAVFSFLSQFDLPTDLTYLEDGEHAILDVHELQPPHSIEPLNSVADGNCVVQDLFPEQCNVPSNLSQAESTMRANEVAEFGRDYPQSIQSTSSTSSKDPSKGGNRNKKLKRTRISNKQQIQTLRETIRGLNTELQSLLPQSQPSRGVLYQSVAGRLTSQRASMWQQIAARQLERRQQSEEENAKLREMLQVQVHEAINLKRVLKRRTKLDEMLGMKRHKLLACNIPDDNTRVFSDMLLNVDELYVSTEDLFVDKGMYDLPCPGRLCDAKSNAPSGLFLEIMQRHLMPFGLNTTEKATYKAMRQISFLDLRDVEDFVGRVYVYSHGIQDTNNIIKASYFVETPNLECVRGVRFWKVVQKYVEKGRVVFICKTLMEPVFLKTENTSGFHTRTTLRIVLRLEDSQSAKENPATRIESHFSATRYDSGLPGVMHKSPNLEVGIAAWDKAISQIAHQVESLAIDESCVKPAGARV